MAKTKTKKPNGPDLVQRRMKMIRDAVGDAFTGLTNAEHDELTEMLLCDADGWREEHEQKKLARGFRALRSRGR